MRKSYPAVWASVVSAVGIVVTSLLVIPFGSDCSVAVPSAQQGAICVDTDGPTLMYHNGSSFVSVGGGGATPGGSDTYVQYNDGGSALGGDAGMTYDDATDVLSVSGFLDGDVGELGGVSSNGYFDIVSVPKSAGLQFQGDGDSYYHGISIANTAALTANRITTFNLPNASRDITFAHDFSALGGPIELTADGGGSSSVTLPATGTLATDVAFTGDSGSGGVKGLVPAPAAGDAAASKFLKADGTWTAISGGGDALVANPLSQFASTTSAQLAGVISNETGSGSLVFGTSPGFTTAANPVSSDGAALGTTTLMWSDLFLASGGVINFNNGNATLTHSAGLLTSNVPLSLGTSNALTAGTIELGAASDTTLARSGAGAITLEGVAVPTISSTSTLTNKRITPRIGTTASSSTPTPNADANDQYNVTALAAGATFGAPTGTPTDGQKLIIRIKDNGTSRSLAWNAIYRGDATYLTLPTATIVSKTMYLTFIYNAADTKWDFVGFRDNL